MTPMEEIKSAFDDPARSGKSPARGALQFPGMADRHQRRPAAKILDVVETIAREVSATPEEVGDRLGRWPRGIILIIGPRTTAQLTTNLARQISGRARSRSPERDAVSAVPLGYPDDMPADPGSINVIVGGNADLLDAPVTTPGSEQG
jgi:hypothetical protein